MKPCEPAVSACLAGPGCRRVVYAENQPEYQPLPALVTPDGRVACQWKPDASELALLNAGVPITIVMHTFNQPLQPLSVSVGGVDLR
jgi:hypothetical protein